MAWTGDASIRLAWAGLNLGCEPSERDPSAWLSNMQDDA